MTPYQYTATTPDGKTLHGAMQADDEEDLSRRLKDVGLTLVVAHADFGPAAAASAAPDSQTLAPSSSRFQNRSFRLTVEAVCVVVLFIVLWLTPRSGLGPLPSYSIQKKIDQIQRGMTRAQVEALFKTRLGNGRLSVMTRYMENKQVILDVPYDSKGGPWSPDNRVIGTPQVSTEYPGAEKLKAKHP